MKKTHLLAIIFAIFGLSSAITAKAQYYEIANQLPGLIQPMLSGSTNYKGFAEAHYLKGVGNYNADFLGASTSQGFQYRSWFFMGVGIGVDVLFSHKDTGFGNWASPDPSYLNHSSATSGVMIPVFTDFRFNIGNKGKTSFYADLKTGCSFLIGKDYVEINNGYLTNQQYFYLRPSVGIRIPVGEASQKGGVNKKAVNVGIDYQLLTSNYWCNRSRNVTLNSLGVSASYEW